MAIPRKLMQWTIVFTLLVFLWSVCGMSKIASVASTRVEANQSEFKDGGQWTVDKKTTDY